MSHTKFKADDGTHSPPFLSFINVSKSNTAEAEPKFPEKKIPMPVELLVLMLYDFLKSLVIQGFAKMSVSFKGTDKKQTLQELNHQEIRMVHFFFFLYIY